MAKFFVLFLLPLCLAPLLLAVSGCEHHGTHHDDLSVPRRHGPQQTARRLKALGDGGPLDGSALEALLEALKPASRGPAVLRLKQLLASLGYLKLSAAAKNATLGALDDLFDGDVEGAVTRFQLFWKLPLSSSLTKEFVKALLQTKRCGFPDILNRNFWDGQEVDLRLATFKLDLGAGRNATAPAGARRRNLLFSRFEGNPQWPRTDLTYGFENSEQTPDLPQTDVEFAFTSALQTWAAVTPLRFTQVPFDSADIKIRFRPPGEHDEGDQRLNPAPFASNTLAHAFSPQTGELHMNDAFLWERDSAGEPADGSDLQSVAVHELGHILGLGHTNVEGSVMFPSISRNTNIRDLSEDDVAGIQSIYGSGSGDPPVTGGGPPPSSGGGGGGVPPGTSCNCDGLDQVFTTPSTGTDGCRIYCFCEGGSGTLLYCPAGLRLGADRVCYPPHMFSTPCSDSAGSSSSSTLVQTEGLAMITSGPSDELIVDPTKTVIIGARAAATVAPSNGTGTQAGAPTPTLAQPAPPPPTGNGATGRASGVVALGPAVVAVVVVAALATWF